MLDIEAAGIDCRQMIYPVHEAQHFSQDFADETFPVSERISHNSLHLPSATQLPHENIEIIAESVLNGLELYS
jgi:Predicted pyridoxal phosphate-dependent enzyme apparently involved in regulation of cell wall biogenesis